MKRTCLCGLVLIGFAFGNGCSSQEKKTRKITIEGPEKKTELKLESTKKD